MNDGAMSFLSNGNLQATYMSGVTFRNCLGYQGAAIKSTNGGIVYCSKCNFTAYWGGYANKTVYAMTYYMGGLQMLTYVAWQYLATLSIQNNTMGQIYLENSYN